LSNEDVNLTTANPARLMGYFIDIDQDIVDLITAGGKAPGV